MVHYQTTSQTTIFSLINLQRRGIEITITNTNKKQHVADVRYKYNKIRTVKKKL